MWLVGLLLGGWLEVATSSATYSWIMIPYINHTSDAVLSNQLDAHQVNVREVIDKFKSQCDSFSGPLRGFHFNCPGTNRCDMQKFPKARNHRKFWFCGAHMLPVEFVHVDFSMGRELRHSSHLSLFKCSTNRFTNSFFPTMCSHIMNMS